MLRGSGGGEGSKSALPTRFPIRREAELSLPSASLRWGHGQAHTEHPWGHRGALGDGEGDPQVALLEVARVWLHLCLEKTRSGLPGILSVKEPG